MYPHEAMIRFTYRLGGAGWATATVADEQAEVMFPASYLCDALRDFVDAVQSLFVTTTAECVWEEEPGEVRWLFRRNETFINVQEECGDRRDVSSSLKNQAAGSIQTSRLSLVSVPSFLLVFRP